MVHDFLHRLCCKALGRLRALGRPLPGLLEEFVVLQAAQVHCHVYDSGLMGAEGMLMGAMSRFMAVVEGYPDLKANENMSRIMEELTSTENKVAFARQAYNDSVMGYNTAKEKFPAVVLAGMMGFQNAEFFEIEEEEQREAPKVEF